MCSTHQARIARISQAIDEIAAQSGHASLGELATRLDSLWAMLAELDPAVAERVAGYCPEP